MYICSECSQKKHRGEYRYQDINLWLGLNPEGTAPLDLEYEKCMHAQGVDITFSPFCKDFIPWKLVCIQCSPDRVYPESFPRVKTGSEEEWEEIIRP